MEFLHGEPRSIESYHHQKKNEKVGLAQLALLIGELKQQEYEKPQIVFKTINLTKNLSQSQESQEIHYPNQPNPCFLSSLRLDTPPCNDISSNPENLPPNSASRITPNGENGFKTSVPSTVCVKHGEAASLPFEHIKTLPEYTCTTWRYPIFKEIHRLEDCVLEFHDGD